jgi:hypothetical protein
LAGATMALLAVYPSSPDAKLVEVLKQPVKIRDPQNQNNHYQSIQDRLDLTLHRDESVHNPQQNTRRNNRDENGGKWHFVFSSHFLDSIPMASSRSYEQLTHLV